MSVSLNSKGMNLDFTNPTSSGYYVPPSSCKVGCMFLWQSAYVSGGVLPSGGTYDGVCSPRDSSGNRGEYFILTSKSGGTNPYSTNLEAPSTGTGIWMRRA